MCAGPLRAWSPATMFHGVWDWSRVPGLLPISAVSLSMDHEHGTVCQPILEHQIRLSAPSSVIWRPTCFSSSLRCCWPVCSALFVRRRCDCLASSALFTNIHTYLLTYLLCCGNRTTNIWALLRWCFTKRRYIKCRALRTLPLPLHTYGYIHRFYFKQHGYFHFYL